MTGADLELRAEEQERDNLQRMISALEAAHAASSPASRAGISMSLMNLQGRLVHVEKRIKEAEGEATRAKQEAAAAMIEREAENETKLNTEEKRTFSGFLKENFFTKRDFGRLETFYANTWDRLSEHGKDEMSHRVWEGIRRDEYKFSELPEDVREKEAKRTYGVLTKQSVPVAGIPEIDRQDFIRAYEAGKREDVAKILERNSFKENLFENREFVSRHQVVATAAEKADSKKVEAAVADNLAKEFQQAPAGCSKAAENFTPDELQGVLLTDANSPPSSSDIPNARTSPAAQRSMPGS